MNKKEQLLAKKYAVAFLNCYGKQITIHDYCNFKKAGLDINNNGQFLSLLAIPYLSHATKLQALEFIKTSYDLPAVFDHLYMLLLNHQRFALLGFVFNAIVVEYEKINNLLSITIRSSAPLEQDVVASIKLFVMQQTGRHILATVSVDTTLIAGIRIESTTYTWEYSIAQQLRLANQFFTTKGCYGY